MTIPGFNRPDVYLDNKVHKVVMVNPDGTPFAGSIGGGGGGGVGNIHVSTEPPTNDVGADGDLWIRTL